MRRHHDGVVRIGDKHYTASDGTLEFVYREVVKKRGKWRRKLFGSKGTIEELLGK